MNKGTKKKGTIMKTNITQELIKAKTETLRIMKEVKKENSTQEKGK